LLNILLMVKLVTKFKKGGGDFFKSIIQILLSQLLLFFGI